MAVYCDAYGAYIIMKVISARDSSPDAEIFTYNCCDLKKVIINESSSNRSTTD